MISKRFRLTRASVSDILALKAAGLLTTEEAKKLVNDHVLHDSNLVEFTGDEIVSLLKAGLIDKADVEAIVKGGDNV